MFSYQKIIPLLIILSTNGFAYEVETHQKLSELAFERSILADSNEQLLINFGLIDDFNNINPIFQTSTGIQDQSIVDLIKFGAEFEDDGKRGLNHFYDPQNLGRPGIFSQGTSIEWALENIGEIDGQDFSYRDASDRFKIALIAPMLPERNQNWGLTFQSLGQVIHHIQDMAQPQHVRDDDHCNLFICAVFFSRKISAYEKYTAENHDKLAAILNLTIYPDIDLREFNSSRAFWDGTGTNDGIGLAEFTSTNFVSIGTNFSGGIQSGNNIINVQTHDDYDFPSSKILEITSRRITDEDLLGPPGPNHQIIGDIQFIGTQVTDAYISSESRVNPRTSSFSIFDSDLEEYNFKKTFTLTRFNYDAAHEFLIPRAVAYSAGLINYFFRGRIEVEITADGDGIEITNISNGGIVDAASPTTFQAGGAFEVFYETKAGERKPLLSLANLELGSSLSVNDTHTITGLSAALQGDTDSCGEKKIIVLFDGEIGSERGIAVTTVKATTSRVALTSYANTYRWGGWSPTDWVNPSSIDISNTEGTDLADCGSKYYMFTSRSTGSINRVYQFDLDPVNTINPLVYNGKFFVPGLSRRGYMRMSNDGFHMILESGHVLYKYTLATPFEVTTAIATGDSYAATVGVSGFDTSVDGTKLYMATWDDYIIEYSMSPAWDIKSLTQTGTSISVLTEMGERNIADVKMSTSGTMMLAIAGSTRNVSDASSRYDKVYRYDLSTAFDLSTASYSEVLTTEVFSDESRSIAGEALEDLFLIWEFGDNFIYQYDAPN